MDYKKIIKNWFLDKKTLLFYRFKYSKRLFIILTLVFFLNFFLVSAKIKDNIFLETLSISYYLFLLWFLIYIYYLIKNKFLLDDKKSVTLIIILSIIYIILWFTFSWFSL